LTLFLPDVVSGVRPSYCLCCSHSTYPLCYLLHPSLIDTLLCKVQTTRMTTANETTPLLAALVAGDAQEAQLSNVGANKEVTPSVARQIAPDLLRGLLMAFMAIDHTSLVFGVYPHGTGIVGETATTVIREWNGDLPYILRSLSHLCASGFTMLLGMGIAYFTASVSTTSLFSIMLLSLLNLLVCQTSACNKVCNHWDLQNTLDYEHWQ
jgi:hypothetical protein